MKAATTVRNTGFDSSGRTKRLKFDHQVSTNTSIPVSNDTNHQMKRFKCLYSHQKLKKKKTWLDGELRILRIQKRCILYKIDENTSTVEDILDSKYCPDIEIDRILNGIADSIEFEKYLVEIDHTTLNAGIDKSSLAESSSQSTISTSSTSARIPSLNKIEQLTSKLKKTPFKVPQTVRPVEEFVTTKNNQDLKPNDVSSNKRGYYCINEEELDDIWDSTHQASTNQPPVISKHSLSQLDFNFDTPSTVPSTVASNNFSSIFSSKGSLIEKDIATPPHVNIQNSSTLNDPYDNEDSNWPQYGEVQEENYSDNYYETEYDPLPHQEVNYPANSSMSVPENVQTNIWSRLFDTNHIGLVDESSN